MKIENGAPTLELVASIDNNRHAQVHVTEDAELVKWLLKETPNLRQADRTTLKTKNALSFPERKVRRVTESEGLHLNYHRVKNPNGQACGSSPEETEPGDNHMFVDRQGDITAAVVALPVMEGDTTQYLVLLQRNSQVEYQLFVMFSSTPGSPLNRNQTGSWNRTVFHNSATPYCATLPRGQYNLALCIRG